jgi:hypothetical protein
MTSQLDKDEWKTLYQTDCEWLRCKKDGSEPYLEVVQEINDYEDEEGCKLVFEMYRFDIDRLKLEPDPEDFTKLYLVPASYDPSWPHAVSRYVEWFADDLEAIAQSIGEPAALLALQFTSEDPKVRASAYMAVAGYHGLANFDSYPFCSSI